MMCVFEKIQEPNTAETEAAPETRIGSRQEVARIREN